MEASGFDSPNEESKWIRFTKRRKKVDSIHQTRVEIGTDYPLTISTSTAQGGFHKPIYVLHQALMPCTKLLCLKKLFISSVQSVKWLCAQLLAFKKLTLSLKK